MFVKQNISPILNVINRCPGPVHIVVTKWDLVESRYALGNVRAALLAHKGLRQLVDRRKDGAGRWLHSTGRVRLIPVSSVGSSFVYIDAQGYLRKRPGTEPDPLNVLVPFAAVLPDLCIQAAEEADGATRAAAAARRRESWQRDIGSFSALGFELPLAGIAMVVSIGLAATSRAMVRLVMKGRVPIGVALAVAVEPRLKRVRSESAAFRYLMKQLARRLHDFERRSPESRLA